MLIENYLFILTEDPEMDKLEKEYSEAKKETLKAGAGPEGGDRLSSMYAGKAEHEIPEKHRKIIRNYKEKVANFSDISARRKAHLNWINNGKKGPKPSSHSSSHSSYYGKAYANTKDWMKDNPEHPYTKRYKRSMFRNRMAVWTIFVYFSFKASKNIYNEYLSKAARSCKGNVGIKKEICTLKYKSVAYKQQINSLKEKLIQCKNTNNPEKCKSKINERIKKIKTKIVKADTRAKELSNYI